jgi:octaprenyl-diphosphate synthase
MQDNTAEIPSSTKSGTREILSQYLKSIDGLQAVENLIREKLISEAPALSEISSYLLDLGGKRIRPALCLICAKALSADPSSESLIQIAAGIELIHMATLLHDDIIDKSKIRRHKSSPFLKYGANDTLLTGDFLLVRAFSLCSKLDQYIIEKTEQACVELTEGEILELPLTEKIHDLDSSLLISRKKTAALFRLACECAAHLSSSNEEVIKDFSLFGESIGIAFQILDDILDVTASEDVLGKEPGSDIRERKPSVVNVLWLASGSLLSKRLLDAPTIDEEVFVSQSLLEIQNSEIIAQAKTIAKKYAANSDSLLEKIMAISKNGNSEAFAALRGLVDYCIQRME